MPILGESGVLPTLPARTYSRANFFVISALWLAQLNLDLEAVVGMLAVAFRRLARSEVPSLGGWRIHDLKPDRQ